MQSTPTADEAMLADVRRQLEALRTTDIVAAAARASQQQRCVVCFLDFDAAHRFSCDNGATHSICADCLSGHVARELEKLKENENLLAAHRERGGKISCKCSSDSGCDSVYSDRTVARCLPEEEFRAYLAAQDTTRCHLICPITQELFSDPVTAADGRTYEREAILRWFNSRATSPLTNRAISTNLVENVEIRNLARKQPDYVRPPDPVRVERLIPP